MIKHLMRAEPVLASLDIAKTITFYVQKLGFNVTYQDKDYGIVKRDDIGIHFWKCKNKIFPEHTSCYIYVQHIDDLYTEMQYADVVHPNGKIGDKPWGVREFAILDNFGNLIKFGQPLEKT